MNPEQLRKLMEAVREGEVSPEAACERLKNLPLKTWDSRRSTITAPCGQECPR